MKTKLNLFEASLRCAVALGMGSSFSLAAAANDPADATPARASEAIPWSQIGAKAGADYQGDGLTVMPTAEGARLPYLLQRIDATRKELTARMEVEPTANDRQVGVAASRQSAAVSNAESGGSLTRRPYALPGANGTVRAAVVDGSGNLYIGGEFTAVGDVSANCIAKWNGNRWSALGSGMDGGVEALAVSGRDLYAGGHFTVAGGGAAKFIAKWNGSSWTALGSGMDGGYGGLLRESSVFALAVSGGDVYAGGDFTMTGGGAANFVAKWNGSRWAALGSGMNDIVLALAVSGTSLYVGGKFTTAGGIPANGIAKWSRSRWAALGSGMNDVVWALAVSGSNVYAGGCFTRAGETVAFRIAKWNGSSWTALDSGMIGGGVSALAVSGSDLYAGGYFTWAGGIPPANLIAKWNGSRWSALGSGMAGFTSHVSALAVLGSDLYAGGDFRTAGDTVAFRIAKWNGSSWSPLGSGMNK